MDRRSREFKELVKMTPSHEELVGDVIDGEYFAYKYESTCKICNASDDLKSYIDTLLLYPKSYKEVLRSIQTLQDKLGIEGNDRINYDNIRNHQKKHLPLEKQLVREIVERRAMEKGISILETGDKLLTAKALYDVIIHKGFEELVNGVNKPTLTQTMAAMEALEQMNKEELDSYRPEELINQLDIILLAIREVLPNDMKEKLFKKIEEYQGTEKKKRSSRKELESGEEEVIEYIDEDLLED